MKFLLATKKHMTQIFLENGTVIPVTVVQSGLMVVTQVKTVKADGYQAVQIGFGSAKHQSKPRSGHLKGLAQLRTLKEFRVDSGVWERGQQFDVSSFAVGDKVTVTGQSKGKGFQGVVKRHKFSGSPATHGHKDQQRMPGSIGSTDPQHVFKGMRMAGHMGDEQVSVHNIEVVAVDTEKQELFLKGAVPGATDGLIWLTASEGELKAITAEEKSAVTASVAAEKPVEAEVVAEAVSAPVTAEPEVVSTAETENEKQVA